MGAVSSVPQRKHAARGWIGYALLALFVLVYPFVRFQVGPLQVDFTFPYARHLLILIFLYALTAQAWNILAGYCGQVSFGHVAYFGIGAYTSSMLLMNFHLTPWLGMLAGGVAAVVLGLLVGLPTFRLTGHYFAIATLAIAETVQTLFMNWNAAGEAKGLWLPVMKDSLLNFQWKGKLPYYYVALALLCLVYLATYWMERSKLGFYFRAIRDDAVATSSLGVDILKYKLVALSLSAFFSALAGSFYAQYVLFIDPFSVLHLQHSVLVVLLATFGGVGTYWGPIVGTAILVPVSEYVRIRFGGTGGAEDLIVYGILIVLIAVIEPAGIVGIYRRHIRPRLFRREGMIDVHDMSQAAGD
ncbi:MAG TPA: branched-chain amino acid ABC transporter permease [Candidatus Methylomirabilis sp.]|nr:branched-chain amino acid ABC transporter permease [Candidatus Methylomirabilis sp.]HSC70287.1 branched-chain amino acid ABC transporter permease [Candidatus Methylomirabilis sp.]